MEDERQANLNKEPATPREMFADRLRREREGRQPEPAEPASAPEPDMATESLSAGQPDADLVPQEEYEDEDEEGAVPTAEDGEAEDGDSDIPAEYRKQIDEWRTKAEKAEEARQSMERDYRRKTHKIAEASRELEDGVAEAVQTVQYLAGRAQERMAKYQGIDWADIQARDPAQFQSAQRAYAQDLQAARQAEQEHQTVLQRAREMREQAREREAALSKEVLPAVIPEWGQDHYVRLRDYAAEQLDMTPAEVDAVTDWRMMRMIHRLWEVDNAGQRVTRRPQATSKPPRGVRNTPTGQTRNARGQYTAAKRAAQGAPGDRQKTREMFAAKLRAERER